jgi:Chaperone of endosialidase
MGLTAGAIQVGVIAQEVQAVFPELVVKHESGYLMVDYPGLAMRIAAATEEMRERIARLTSAEKPSDEVLKEAAEPISQALERLGRGDARISKEDYQALVGALVEAVKQLDTRVSDLEGREEAN